MSHTDIDFDEVEDMVVSMHYLQRFDEEPLEDILLPLQTDSIRRFKMVKWKNIMNKIKNFQSTALNCLTHRKFYLKTIEETLDKLLLEFPQYSLFHPLFKVQQVFHIIHILLDFQERIKTINDVSSWLNRIKRLGQSIEV